MQLVKRFERVIGWAAAHERWLGVVLFVGGFVGNVVTFKNMSLMAINWSFAFYLMVAGLCTIGTHRFALYRARDTWKIRTLSALLPLGAHFAIGSLLSGFAVFYAEHAEASVSWPFLSLLFVAAILGEYWSRHKSHLVFQTIAFFFSLYAYLIFLVPLLTHTLGALVFIESTAATALVFVLFMLMLRFTNLSRLKESRRSIAIGSSAILLVVTGAYFTGLIPPVPLVASVADVYQQFSRTNGVYELATDSSREWWDPRPRTLAHQAGTPLYAFSSVVAPGEFTTTIVHVWEWYDESTGTWTEKNRVPFPILGGRPGGYRGYTIEQDPAPGKWRLTVETETGQVIARVPFMVVDAATVTLTRHETY